MSKRTRYAKVMSAIYSEINEINLMAKKNVLARNLSKKFNEVMSTQMYSEDYYTKMDELETLFETWIDWRMNARDEDTIFSVD
jgi:5'-deoxynucleotidase YfbR-like HD superfamily hydrolase